VVVGPTNFDDCNGKAKSKIPNAIQKENLKDITLSVVVVVVVVLAEY